MVISGGAGILRLGGRLGGVEWLSTPPFFLWELIRTDVAEAKFIELSTSQLMKFIDHVIVPTLELAIDSSSFQYHQLKRTLKEMPRGVLLV